MNKNNWPDLQVKKIENADIVICGIPFDEACSCARGAALGPDQIRNLSTYMPPVAYNGEMININVFDSGNIENYNPQKVDDLIVTAINTDKYCLFLGGDHSVSIPIQQQFIQKYNNKKIGIIHCDAHLDICDIFDENKFSHANVNRRAIDHGISVDDIVMLGIRSWERQEVKFIEEHKNLCIYPMVQIRKQGINYIVKEIIKKFQDYDALYLSIDIDVCDPAYAPGTGTPEPGGLLSNELMDSVKELLTHLPIKIIDVVEVSPPLDINNITSWLAIKLIYEIFYCIDKKVNN